MYYQDGETKCLMKLSFLILPRGETLTGLSEEKYNILKEKYNNMPKKKKKKGKKKKAKAKKKKKR